MKAKKLPTTVEIPMPKQNKTPKQTKKIQTSRKT